MSPAAAVGSLYARSSGTWMLAATTMAVTVTLACVVSAYASLLEPGQRESLVVIGMALGVLWIPAVVGVTARRQLQDARERMLPRATAHVQVAVAILIAAYFAPALAIAVWMGGDPVASAGMLGIIGACVWRVGWSEGRSLAILLVVAAIASFPSRSFLRGCLHGGNPLGSSALLGMAALVIFAVVATSLRELRSDLLRLGPEEHWLHRAAGRWWRSPRWKPYEPVDATAWSWARHLSRGWRAEVGSPLVLVLIAAVGSSCVSLIAAHERRTPADLGEASIVGVAIFSLQWLSLLGANGGPSARADAARPIGRDRFAGLVLLVAARSLLSSWAFLWAGAFTGFLAERYVWSGTAPLAVASAICAQHLAMLPVLIAYFAWVLSLRGRVEMAVMLVLSQIVLVATALPMLHGPDGWLNARPVMIAAFEVVIGVAGCWLAYRRWRTLDIS